jgi:hypothetical protein
MATGHQDKHKMALKGGVYIGNKLEGEAISKHPDQWLNILV